ncbi:MAG: hypothetical protein ACFCVK_23860 [Acidimicrobiales bacterium]
MNVDFDYDGALHLARELHAAAGELERLAAERRAVIAAALASWRGPFADDFRVRADVEADETRRVVAALVVEALDWAQAWSDAVNEHNRRARQRRLDELDAARGAGDRLVDWLTGGDPAVGDSAVGDSAVGDSAVGDVVWVAPPRSPDFLPTGGPQAL